MNVLLFFCFCAFPSTFRIHHSRSGIIELSKEKQKNAKEKKWNKTVDGVRCLRYPYLSEIGSQALQNIVDRIANAYHLFFVNLENGRKTSPPKYKKVRKYKSFTLKQAGWKLDEGSHSVYIGKHKYRYFKSREIAGKVQTVTVKRDNLWDLYIYFVCQDDTEAVKPRTGKSVGFDFGFKGKMLIASDFSGDVAEPMFIRARAKELRKITMLASRNCFKKERTTMAQIFKTKEAAEKAAQSVNYYLKEQQMYLEVTVVAVEGGYAVAVVSCY